MRPPFGDIPETRVLVRVPIPHKIFIQSSSGWEALAGEEEPGGREEKRIDGEERRVFKKEALRRGTSFKNSYVAWRRLFRK